MVNPSTIFIVMGVSGCGKSTIGKLLASAFEIPFFDGDDFHPKANVEKMSRGIPLKDSDRTEWLECLNELAMRHKSYGAVIACSALKKTYRHILKGNLDNHIEFVHLDGTKAEILQRLEERKGHFMPIDLLDSQFDALEPPKNAIKVSIDTNPQEIVLDIISQFGTKKP